MHPLGPLLDYRKTNAARSLLPNPAILTSSGWQDLHLELFQQPKFEVAEHHHTMHVIAYAPSGLSPLNPSAVSIGERWLDGKLQRETRRAGDLAIIPAHMAHRCNWDGSVQFMVLAIEPKLLSQVGQDWIPADQIELLPQFMVQQDPLIQNVLTTLKQEAETSGMGSALLIDSLKTALAIHLLRHYCVKSPKPEQATNGLSQVQLALVTDYIHDHLHQDLSLVKLATLVQISPYYFLRLFKQSLGITPHQYILQYRVYRAKDLLQYSELSIADIAASVGFCDQSHLNRHFKRTFGLTPKQFLQA